MAERLRDQLIGAWKLVSNVEEPVKRSRHRFASSRWHPVLTPGARERHEAPTGEPS